MHVLYFWTDVHYVFLALSLKFCVGWDLFMVGLLLICICELIPGCFLLRLLFHLCMSHPFIYYVLPSIFILCSYVHLKVWLCVPPWKRVWSCARPEKQFGHVFVHRKGLVMCLTGES